MTDFSSLILSLIDSGMTEEEIAKLVSSSQPTINRVKLGKQKNIGYELGNSLIQLSKKPKQSKQKVSA